MSVYTSPAKRRISEQHIYRSVDEIETGDKHNHENYLSDKLTEKPSRVPLIFHIIAGRMRRRLVPRQIAFLLAIASVITIITIFNLPNSPQQLQEPKPSSDSPTRDEVEPPSFPTTSHPVWSLLTEAQQNFEELKAEQSKSLPEAVAKYRRRYGIRKDQMASSADGE